MPPDDPSIWMWAEACRVLDRAERLHRRFFEFGGFPRQPCWEPPIDMLETETELLVQIALPGVDQQRIETRFERGALFVIGARDLPIPSEPAVIRRLELPYGRFERRIPLPSGQYELTQRHLINGCLLLSLRKLG